MKAALLSLAVLGGQSVLLVSDRVPQFDVEASCMETIAENERLGLVGIETPSDCMQEETAAQRKLSSVWATTERSIRDRCEEQVNKSDVHSYVNLLMCVEEVDSPSSPSSPKGASKRLKPK